MATKNKGFFEKVNICKCEYSFLKIRLVLIPDKTLYDLHYMTVIAFSEQYLLAEYEHNIPDEAPSKNMATDKRRR